MAVSSRPDGQNRKLSTRLFKHKLDAERANWSSKAFSPSKHVSSDELPPARLPLYTSPKPATN